MSDCRLDLRSDGVAVLTLDRPERRNALSPAMIELLGEHLAACEADPTVRCLMLTGAGTAFCAGGDIGGMKGQSDAAQVGRLAVVDERIRALRARQDRTALRLHMMAKPTVAVVNGPAVGAGMSLALACDIRLMSEDAKLSAGFARMALSGDMGGTYFLSQLVNTAVARELCFTGEDIPAERAFALGLANHVHPHGRLMEEALTFCAGLARGPTAAFARIKENLAFSAWASAQAAADFEARNMIIGAMSSDHREAVQAFLEKRSPKFVGG